MLNTHACRGRVPDLAPVLGPSNHGIPRVPGAVSLLSRARIPQVPGAVSLLSRARIPRVPGPVSLLSRARIPQVPGAVSLLSWAGIPRVPGPVSLLSRAHIPGPVSLLSRDRRKMRYSLLSRDQRGDRALPYRCAAYPAPQPHHVILVSMDTFLHSRQPSTNWASWPKSSLFTRSLSRWHTLQGIKHTPPQTFFTILTHWHNLFIFLTSGISQPIDSIERPWVPRARWYSPHY